MPLHYVLNATKTLSNYGLIIKGSTYDPIFSQGYINSKPNISIIGSSCFIDYSQSFNISDLTYLKKVFNSTPVGTTFALSQGDYYDQELDYTVNLDGVFSFESLKNNDKLIIGGISSGFTYTSNYKLYYKENFLNPPQYSTTYVGGATAQNYILNNITNNPAKSFLNSGFIGSAFGKEEYVEITGSTLNLGKIKVNSVNVLKDNREVLYTDTTLTDEDLSTVSATSTQYLRGNANPEILGKSRKALGCYVVIDSNGNQITCFENQNQLQAFLRGQYENETYTAYWLPCLFCSRLNDNSFSAINADKAISFDSVLMFKVLEQPVVTFTPSNEVTINYTYTLQSNYTAVDVLAETSEVELNVDTGFKFDLSNPTLKGFSVTFFSDQEKTTEYQRDVYVIGFPGFDQASVIVSKTINTPKKLYAEFKGPVSFTVDVILN